MKKIGALLFLVILIVIAAIAVLCVTYPDMQPQTQAFFENAWERIGNFFGAFFEPIEEAFVKS